MCQNTQPPRHPDDERREDARVGYETAIGAWARHDETVWARFNVMLVANSILVAAVVLILAGRSDLYLLAVVIPALGIFLCVLWHLIMTRAFAYGDYLRWSATELEEEYFQGIVKTFSRGKSFADGQKVTMHLAGQPQETQMSAWSRLLKARHISYVVIVLFALLYLVTLLQIVLSHFAALGL